MQAHAVVLAMVLSLVGAACGARLTDAQRQQAIQALGGEGGTSGDATTPGATPRRGTGTAGRTGPGTIRGGGTGTVAGTPTAGGPTVPGPGTGADPGTQTPTGQTPTAQGCQSNGKSTDTGVSGDTLTIATASDVTGPSPGLFKSTHQAVQAYADYVNTTQGGVCGRELKVVALDTKTDSGANRAAVLDACDKAFALVGSMSAFDDGGAAEVDNCKIPDLSAITVNTNRTLAEYTFPIFPAAQSLVATGGATYVAQQHPQAVKKAAILWLNGNVTRYNAQARQEAWTSAGFDFVYEREVQVVEANYTPFVLEMQGEGVEYVTMVADNSSLKRLLQAADQQDWHPEVWDLDSVAYDPGFVQAAGKAAEGVNVFVNTAMFEEADGNPEMAAYLQWLQISSPGAEYDYFGIYAWSAAKLFVETATAIGPDLTREKLVTALRGENDWDGGGLHGPQKVGKKQPTSCFLYMTVQGGRFVRQYPNRGWECGLGELYAT